MKHALLVTAAIAVGAMIVPVTADAAMAPDRHGWHDNHGGKWKTVCSVQWRHGHKVRTCRKVRSW